MSFNVSLELKAKVSLSWRNRIEKSLEYADFLKKIGIFHDGKFSGIVGDVDYWEMKNCISWRNFAIRTCENGHKEIIASKCSIRRLCPRCHNSFVLHEIEEIATKFERFDVKSFRKIVFTVPEEFRDIVWADLEKFGKVCIETLTKHLGMALLGGIYVIHEYSTREPSVINPHVEVIIGRLAVKNREYEWRYSCSECVFKNRCVMKPDERNECKRRKRRFELKDVEFADIDLWEHDLKGLRKTYKEIFEREFKVKVKVINPPECSFITSDEWRKFKYHTLLYALKQPVNPESLNVNDNIVVYITKDKKGKENIFIDTIDNFKKAFDLNFYKKNWHSYRWFGFLANNLWHHYYEKYRNEKFKKPKKELVKWDRCTFCGSRICHVKTNLFLYRELSRGFEIECDYDPEYEYEIALNEQGVIKCEEK